MLDINWNPNNKELRVFSALLIVFGIVLATMVNLRTGHVTLTMISLAVTWGCSIIWLRRAYITSPTAVANAGLFTWSVSPPTPTGHPRRMGKSKIWSAISGIPSRIEPPPVNTIPELSERS